MAKGKGEEGEETGGGDWAGNLGEKSWLSDNSIVSNIGMMIG